MSYKLQLNLGAVCALFAAILTLDTVPALAQIPASAVDAALNGPTTTMMLTATSAHTYRHRTRIEQISVQRTGGALVATGKIVNVIKWDSDGVMDFQITCRAGQAPDIQILSTKESKTMKRTLKKIIPIAEKALPIIVAAVASNDGGASQGGKSGQSFDLQTVADGAGAGDEVKDLDQKDWKVPAMALMGAIAARLQASL